MSEETYEQIKAERDAYRSELSAVMPKDYKDWWQTLKSDWPLVAAQTITALREREAIEIKMRHAAHDKQEGQRQKLIDIWAGSARSGRWLFEGAECSNTAEGAEWEPYTDEEQAAWMSNGVVTLLELLLFTDVDGKVRIPADLLAEHGFNEEPEEDTRYPRTNAD